MTKKNGYYLLCIFSILMLLVSCEPEDKDIFNTEQVKVFATIESNSETINLGDTIKIKLKIPDTLVTNTSTQIVQSLQRGQFGMKVFKMDTSIRNGSLVNSSNYWVSKGTQEGNLSFVTSVNQKPYECFINFKAQEKGLYYIEVINQPGQLKINNNYEARLFVNFNVPNKHYNILGIISPFFGGQPFYDAVVQKDTEGFGAYFFRVN